MKRWALRLLLSLVVLLVSWTVFTGVMIWNYGSKDHSQQSDCIIVLGAAAYGVKPSPVFEERIQHGITLLRRGDAPLIIFTGGRSDGTSHAESDVAEIFAIAEGIASSTILTETKSRTTQQNLIEAKVLMDAGGLDTATIVSDPLHLRRAATMAEDLGISAVTSPTPTTRYQSLRPKLGFLLREIFFYNFYLITGN